MGKTTLAVGDVDDSKVKTVKPFYAEKLPPSLRYHADLTLCHLGEKIAVAAPESCEYYKSVLEPFGFEIISGEKHLDMHYPDDASYNVATLGDKIFCRKDITDPVLIKTAEKMGYTIINMKQGYGKCSVCPVDEKSAISADVSFWKAAKNVGADVLLITNETVTLKGYDNGFFGGCAYMRDKSTFCANGDLTTHPDFERIVNFLKERNVSVECDKGKNFLYDFGSFIPLTEE